MAIKTNTDFALYSVHLFDIFRLQPMRSKANCVLTVSYITGRKLHRQSRGNLIRLFPVMYMETEKFPKTVSFPVGVLWCK